MSVFDQRGQHVGTQHNVAGNLTINSSPQDVGAAIEHALAQAKAVPDLSADIQKQVAAALEAAKKAQPSAANTAIRDDLNSAADNVRAATNFAGAGVALATMLVTIGKWVVGVW